MKHPKFFRAFEVVADLPAPLAGLETLGRNFWWTWNPAARDIFRSVDKDLWDRSDHNPIGFLNNVARERLQHLAEDRSFLARLNALVADMEAYLSAPTWYSEKHLGNSASIAYFCFEFGISEGLPIYSGGLGVLAGDHLKAASDLGLPLVGVGLLYNRGYFRQRLTHDGWQQEHYPTYDFYGMPLRLMRKDGGDPIRIEVDFPDRTVTCQIWRADVGRVPLYLLDSNVLENAQDDQSITDSLYSGDDEMRIRQEMILGIGGMRALAAVGVQPTVCHMNEGHAAFLSIERIRSFMKEHGCDFRTARQATVASNVFTTHTPVPAGFDMFPPHMLERYMGRSASEVGLGFDEFARLGRRDKENAGDSFNMALLAMENSTRVNGVSELHAEVTRGMFSHRWPAYPEAEVPISAVTNGIHTTTWTGRRIAALLDEYCGPAWRREPENPENWKGVRQIPDEELWAERENQRGELVRFVRRRLQKEHERRGGATGFESVNAVLDPRVLTIGFARRFATYKRGTLMISDPERLKRILMHPERPVQIVISGKAHPRDDAGKGLIQALVRFIDEHDLGTRMVFLEDYDMQVARRLVQGVDVWLNNPRRPYEASGTSGMKVVPNGGLNLSVLDGWWDEGYEPGVGWTIGDRESDPDAGHQDWLDGRDLYDTIENEIAPVYYHRIENGLPLGWLKMVRRSMMRLAPRFSTSRMVAEYAERFYVPASASFEKMAGGDLSRTQDALAWRDRVKVAWPSLAIVSVVDDAPTRNPLGARFTIRVELALGSLIPNDLRVEAVTGKVGPNRELVTSRAVPLAHEGERNGKHLYRGEVVFDSPGHQGYAVRVLPNHPDVDAAAELGLALWH